MSAGLRAGYKQTEVGVIPEDWDCRTLEDLTDPARPIGYGIVQTGKSVFNGVKCVRVVDIIAGRVDPDQLITTTPEISQAYKRTLLREYDLIIALRGKIGAVAVVDQELAGANLTRGVALLSASDSFHSGYLSQYLSSTVGKNTIEKNLNGSALQEIPIAALRKIPAVAPPLPEQRAIAAALSDVDALLDGLDSLIAKKQGLKVAAMQQLLTGETRLPGFSGEWERTELKRLVLTPITDGPHMTPKFYDSGVPFLSVNNLADNRIDLTGLRYISKEDDKIFSIKCKPRVGDVLLGKAASVGKVALVEDDFDFNIWSPIALVRAGDQINAKFLYYQLLSADCIGQIALLTNSSSQGNIGMGDIEKLQISFPERAEQTAIAAILSDMDTELAFLQARRSKTQALKQAMMQELLTGRIRLI